MGAERHRGTESGAGSDREAEQGGPDAGERSEGERATRSAEWSDDLLLRHELAQLGSRQDAYLVAAQTVHSAMMRRLWDPLGGGFFERNSPDTELFVGDHANLHKPALENGVAALACGGRGRCPMVWVRDADVLLYGAGASSGVGLAPRRVRIALLDHRRSERSDRGTNRWDGYACEQQLGLRHALARLPARHGRPRSPHPRRRPSCGSSR